jgi:hypothetical protein
MTVSNWSSTAYGYDERRRKTLAILENSWGISSGSPGEAPGRPRLPAGCAPI